MSLIRGAIAIGVIAAGMYFCWKATVTAILLIIAWWLLAPQTRFIGRRDSP